MVEPTSRISRDLYAPLRVGHNTHHFEGKVCQGTSNDMPVLDVAMYEGARAVWRPFPVRVVEELDVLELPKEALAAIACYASDWPQGADHRLYWLPVVPVPVIVRIRAAAEQRRAIERDMIDFPGESRDDMVARLALIADVEPDVDYRVVWRRLCGRWPALVAKYLQAHEVLHTLAAVNP